MGQVRVYGEGDVGGVFLNKEPVSLMWVYING